MWTCPHVDRLVPIWTDWSTCLLVDWSTFVYLSTGRQVDQGRWTSRSTCRLMWTGPHVDWSCGLVHMWTNWSTCGPTGPHVDWSTCGPVGFPGSLVPRFPGSLVPWFPGSLVLWFPGSWFPGSLVPWFPLVPWFASSLVPWFSDSLWFP